MTNYWLMCFPMPKCVIKKIEATCSSFLWTGGVGISRKSPVSWRNVCTPKSKGGLHIVDLVVWNQVAMLKLLWNLSQKTYSIWVKWIHSFYFKKEDIMEGKIKQSSSGMTRKIPQQRENVGTFRGFGIRCKWKGSFVCNLCMTSLQKVNQRWVDVV